MPDLLIESTRLVGRLIKRRLPTGIDRVCLAYVRHYASVARALVKVGRFETILDKAQSRALFSLLLAPDRDFPRRAAGIFARSAFRGPKRQRCAGSWLLNIGHRGPETPSYAQWLRHKKLRPIFMVHDLVPVTHPEYCRPLERGKHIKRVDTILRTAEGVVTNSHTTLRALTTYAARHGLQMPPAIAAPLAPETFAHEANHRPLSSPYFVMLSTIEPRKNHMMILHVWRRLIERMGSNAPRLVIIGQRGWECENVLDLLDRCDSLRGFVIEERACADAKLVSYLRHAEALLFPSFVEGYGLPLIEALSLGVPAIASDLPVLREIAGDVPDYLDPLDGTGWLQHIESYCGPASELRANQILRMGDFKAPTWAAHFDLFEQLLSRVA
jgi:glycosyltransferase involved in cell wall biosynthesis